MIQKKLSPIFKTELPLLYMVLYNEESETYSELTIPSSKAEIIVGCMWAHMTDRTFTYEKLSAPGIPYPISSEVVKPYMKIGVSYEKPVNPVLTSEFIDYFIKTMPYIGEVDIVYSEEGEALFEVSKTWLSYPISAFFILTLIQLSVLYDGSCTPMEFYKKSIEFEPNSFNESFEAVVEKIRHEDLGWRYSNYVDSYMLVTNCRLDLLGCVKDFEGNLNGEGKFYTNLDQKAPKSFTAGKGSLYSAELAEKTKLFQIKKQKSSTSSRSNGDKVSTFALFTKLGEEDRVDVAPINIIKLSNTQQANYIGNFTCKREYIAAVASQRHLMVGEIELYFGANSARVVRMAIGSFVRAGRAKLPPEVVRNAENADAEQELTEPIAKMPDEQPTGGSGLRTASRRMEAGFSYAMPYRGVDNPATEQTVYPDVPPGSAEEPIRTFRDVEQRLRMDAEMFKIRGALKKST